MTILSSATQQLPLIWEPSISTCNSVDDDLAASHNGANRTIAADEGSSNPPCQKQPVKEATLSTSSSPSTPSCCWWDDDDDSEEDDDDDAEVDLAHLTPELVKERLFSGSGSSSLRTLDTADLSSSSEDDDDDDYDASSCFMLLSKQSSRSSSNNHSTSTRGSSRKVQFCWDATTIYEYEPPSPEYRNELYYREDEIDEFREIFYQELQQKQQDEQQEGLDNVCFLSSSSISSGSSSDSA